MNLEDKRTGEKIKGRAIVLLFKKKDKNNNYTISAKSFSTLGELNQRYKEVEDEKRKERKMKVDVVDTTKKEIDLLKAGNAALKKEVERQDKYIEKIVQEYLALDNLLKKVYRRIAIGVAIAAIAIGVGLFLATRS